MCFRDITPMRVQELLVEMAGWNLAYESKDKIRDTLASIIKSARKFGLIHSNPMESASLPPDTRAKRRNKPYVTAC